MKHQGARQLRFMCAEAGKCWTIPTGCPRWPLPHPPRRRLDFHGAVATRHTPTPRLSRAPLPVPLLLASPRLVGRLRVAPPGPPRRYASSDALKHEAKAKKGKRASNKEEMREMGQGVPSPTAEPTRSATLAWLEGVEARLQRGGKKVVESAEKRTSRALRGELASAVAAGRLEEAERLWQELRGRVGASRMDGNSFHLLMNAYAQRGQLRRTLAFYDQMREWRVRPSPHTYSILFNAFANLKEPSVDYLPRIKRLREVDMPRYGVQPTVEVYNVLLKAFLALDPAVRKQETKQILSEMKERGLKFGDVTYALWMSTAARGNARNPKEETDVAAAFEVWEDMRKSQIKPGLRCYNELLKICLGGSTQDQNIAFELYKEMLLEGVSPDRHTFDILLMACWKQKKFLFANELFDKAIMLNAEKRSLAIDAQLCNSALRVCTRVGKNQLKGTAANEHILNTILRMMHRLHLPYSEDTYALIISAYIRAGATDKAVATFENMQKKGQVQIGPKVVGALVLLGKEMKSVEILQKALESVVERQVHIPEKTIQQARSVFFSCKRRQEWKQLHPQLAQWAISKQGEEALQG